MNNITDFQLRFQEGDTVHAAQWRGKPHYTTRCNKRFSIDWPERGEVPVDNQVTCLLCLGG